MSFSNIDLPKFLVLQGQQNYQDWSLEIESTAMLGGFWPAFVGSNSTASQEASEQDKVSQRELKARGLIMKTCSSTLRIELKSLNTTTTGGPTAQELWDHLKGKFEKQSGISATLDVAQLVQFLFVDDGSIESQLNHHLELRARCALNKFTFDDWMYATFVLIALPESYQATKDSFFAANDLTTLKPADIRACIIETEIRRKAESSASANALTSKKHAGGHKPKRQPGANDACKHCGIKGHWARNCKKKRREKQQQMKSDNPGPPSSLLNVVDHSDAESEVPFFAYLGSPENWLVDSGATDHMSPFGSDFRDYVAFAESRRDNTVMLGDSTTRLRILGKGTIQRWVETSPHTYRLLVLQDVLHVEGIKRRFLSANHFDQKGYTTTIGAGKISIAKEKFSFSGFKTGALYTCTMYMEKPLGNHSLNSVSAPLPIKTWHDCMGHLSWEAIKAVRSNDPPLLGITLDASSPPSTICEGCVAGKAKRRAFKTSRNQATVRICDPTTQLRSRVEPEDPVCSPYLFLLHFRPVSASLPDLSLHTIYHLISPSSLPFTC